MFKILGCDALYVEIADVFKTRMTELAGESEFVDILKKSDVSYMLNGTTEEHTFFVRVPKDITPEKIQAMCDSCLEILGKTVEETPCVEVDGVRQKYQVIITNWEEPEIIGLRKTPGMSSGAVFMPIFESLSKPGRMNAGFQDYF